MQLGSQSPFACHAVQTKTGASVDGFRGPASAQRSVRTRGRSTTYSSRATPRLPFRSARPRGRGAVPDRRAMHGKGSSRYLSGNERQPLRSPHGIGEMLWSRPSASHAPTPPRVSYGWWVKAPPLAAKRLEVMRSGNGPGAEAREVRRLLAVDEIDLPSADLFHQPRESDLGFPRGGAASARGLVPKREGLPQLDMRKAPIYFIRKRGAS